MDYLKINELYHSGIKGMKWGVRRYQNEDGTLTEEGKERYYDHVISKVWSAKDKEKLYDEALKSKELKDGIKNCIDAQKKENEYVKKLEPLEEKLGNTGAWDYNDLNFDEYIDKNGKLTSEALKAYREDLKKMYLDYIKDETNLEALTNYGKIRDERISESEKATNSLLSSKRKNNQYDNLKAQILVRNIIEKEVPLDYLPLGEFDKGPVPKEYLDYIDLYYDLQFYD